MQTPPEPRVETDGGAAVERCWRSIGVHGDASCPKLKQHVHCRNCAVFTASAEALLEREPPPGHLAESTRLVAGAKPVASHDTCSVVIFRLGAEWLALPTAVFEEVVGQRPVHSLPHRRGAVQGIANVRGELLVCMSLHWMLNIGAAQSPAAALRQQPGRLLVLAHGGSRVVCQVDEVRGVHRFDPRQLQEVPATLARYAAAHTRAVLRLPKHTVGVLDEQALFQSIHRSLSSATTT